MRILAVRAKLTCLDIVCEHGRKDTADPVCKRCIKYRSGYFNAALGVSGHEVGAGNIHSAAVSASENINSRMLQKTSDYRDNADIFRFALNSRDKAADASHDKLYCNSSTARFGELFN